RDGKDPRWVQGDVTVTATPDVVWARLARIDEWPRTLTDIAAVKVLERHPGDDGHVRWKIELETRTLGHGMLGYDVDCDPTRALLLSTDHLGVRVAAQTIVRNGPSPETANVVYNFFITLSGLPSLLISEHSLREKQDHMIDVTLADIERAFAKPVSPVVPVAPAPRAAQ
ncbi:MAG TPA: SRPBCC family protein, partial [Polyangiaceae bacterium]